MIASKFSFKRHISTLGSNPEKAHVHFTNSVKNFGGNSRVTLLKPDFLKETKGRIRLGRTYVTDVYIIDQHITFLGNQKSK